jgi:MFS family permease
MRQSVEQKFKALDKLEALNEARLGLFHLKTVLVSGMGFFADAYDLFVIGLVTTILKPIWHLSTGQISFLDSISLLSSLLGALAFGRMADRLGRKAVYGLEVIILTFGALISAFSPNFTFLLVARTILGLGIGGDYSASAIITAEFSNRKNRGRIVGTVFALQGIGLVVGPAVGLALMSLGVPNGLLWRLLLGFGAIPAAAVIWLRRTTKESPRFLIHVKEDNQEAEQSLSWAAAQVTAAKEADAPPSKSRNNRHSNFWIRLAGAAGSWFLLDIAFYGNSISSSILLKTLQPRATLFTNTLTAGIIFLIAALPGYWLSVLLVDRIGRKYIQVQGFLGMALTFGMIATIQNVAKTPQLFVIVFGFSYLFTEFGPNVTTFIYPTEIFPTRSRGTANGIAAGAGKLGAFLGAFFVPLVLQSGGLRAVEAIMAVVALIGALLTMLTLPEPKGLTLEASSNEKMP